MIPYSPLAKCLKSVYYYSTEYGGFYVDVLNDNRKSKLFSVW